MPQMRFQIVCDGSCDLPMSLLKEQHIAIIPYYVSFIGEEYKREVTEMPVQYFYRHMVENPEAVPKTSMPSIQDYCDVFEPMAQAGMPVLCICMTAKFSGSLRSAQVASSIVQESYPDWKVLTMDSTFATALEGIFVLEAAKMRDSNLDLVEAAQELERLRDTGRIFFTIGSMSYLLRGGRAGKLTGKILNRFDVRPLICMKSGEIYPTGMRRSRRSAIEQIITQADKYLASLGKESIKYQLVTGYGYSQEESLLLQQRVWERLGEKYHISELNNYQIGATIGAHTGPYPLGIGCLRRYEQRGE